MAINTFFHSEGMKPFGFHSESFSAPNVVPSTKFWNIMTFATWIPVISAFVGLARFWAVYKAHANDQQELKRALVFRGVIEILSLGALFMIPDLIVTIGRMLSPHPYSVWAE